MVEFDPSKIDTIVDYWKKNYGNKRFENLERIVNEHPEKAEQFYYSILNDDGSIMTAEKFIETNPSRED